jgi:hypothetical protein
VLGSRAAPIPPSAIQPYQVSVALTVIEAGSRVDSFYQNFTWRLPFLESHSAIERLFVTFVGVKAKLIL